MDTITRHYVDLAQSGEYEVCIWGAGYLGTQSGLKLLRERGISINYYCDNNKSLWGKVITEGIICLSPDELQKKVGDKIICFVMVGFSRVRDVIQQIENIGIKKVVLFNDLFAEEKEEYFPFMKQKKIAVYTCIVGNYDELQEPISTSPDCDYYLISDKKPERKTVFQYMDINQYLPDSVTDNTRKNRFCKINAHKIFPQYRYSIYFDGVFRLKSTIVDCFERMPKTRIITSYQHDWPGLYMEAMRVILNKRDAEEIVKKQVEHYWLEGMPENFGSVFCNILLREHNNPVCCKLMEEWWKQVEIFSKRDMISFPYVLWKNGYTMNDVVTITEKYQKQNEYWEDRGVHSQS